jgi:prophage maintenance system killer protein
MQVSIFPMKEFDDWEAITPKTYPALKIKTFIAAAYTCRILSQQLQNTAGKMGYASHTQNMYAALDNNNMTTATEGTSTTLSLAAITTAAP